MTRTTAAPSTSRATTPLHPVALACLLTLAGSLTTTAPAYGQQPAAASPAAARSYSIAAGPLGTALSAFAGQAGVTVSFTPEQTRDLRTAGLQGTFSVEQGFAVLLAGSGLRAVTREGGGYTLQAAPPAAAAAPAKTLHEVTVTAQADRNDGTTEGTGSYTQTGRTATATGLALSLRETPQSISVMTRQRMDDFQLHTMTDVLEQTPGVTLDRQGDGNNFLIRGSTANQQMDGIRQITNGWYANSHRDYTLDDLIEIDRIEVLKGSSGLITGDGNYGGTINMLRKRPTRDFQASVGAGIGSWSNYRADADIGGPLNAAGTLRGRIVAGATDGKGFRDYVKTNSQTLFGTLEADLSPDTVLNVGMTYREREYQGATSSSMIQAYAANAQFLGIKPRSFNVGAPWAGYEQNARTVFANLEHRWANGWSLKLRASDERTRLPYGETGVWWTVIPEAVDVGWDSNHSNSNRGIAFDLKGPVELWGRQHELLVGGDSSRTRSNTYSGSTRFSNLGLDYADGGGAIVRPDLDSLPMDNHSTYSSRRHSVYAAGRFSLADPVKLIAGLRATDYQLLTVTPYASSNQSMRESGVLTPYAGLVVDVHQNVSLYGSYARIFKPQSAQDAQGSTLAPEEGLTYEAGAKGEFFDKRLNASLAYFWMKTDNTAESTGESRPDGTTIYRAVSGVSRRGYELELSGEVARGWQVQGSYVQNSSSLNSASVYPKNQFKLGTSYQLSGALQGLTVGGAARWQSTTSARLLEQPSFWIVDLMARYQINRHLSVSANVNNVFDKSYFAGMRDFGRVQYTWGAPRSVNLSMRYTF